MEAKLDLNISRICCSSESPGKRACFVTSSAGIQSKYETSCADRLTSCVDRYISRRITSSRKRNLTV